MCTDDDDEWTEVSTSQLQHSDNTVADTVHTDTQTRVVTAEQHGQDAVRPSDDSQPSSSPAAVSAFSSSSPSCTDAHRSQEVDDPAACSSDVTETPSNSALTHSMANPVASTDHDSVVNSQSSDHTKSDNMVVLAVTPERTTPSDESSNTKGSLLSVLHLLTIHYMLYI